MAHSYSSSTRTHSSARSTPRHHVSTSTSPLGYLPPPPLATRPHPADHAPALTTCKLHPCSAPAPKDTCSDKKMSVVDILDDLKTSERRFEAPGPVQPPAHFQDCALGGGAEGGAGGGAGRGHTEDIDICGQQQEARTSHSSESGDQVQGPGTASVQDSATSPTERQDLINKIGKRIRFRKKKKEKLKTENRAKKALKTISLILGAFVTCWTPYHILAIIASFCPSCVNIHIYMLSYFLCYANR